MLRLKSALIIGLFSVLSLTACSETNNAVNDAADKAQETAEQAQDSAQEATDKAEEAKDAATESANNASDVVALKDGVTNMKSGVTSTLDAAKTGDFETARTEFSKVQDAWPTLKDSINSDSAQSIQTGIEDVKASLGEGTPDKDKVISALQGLMESVTSIKLG